MKKLEIPTPDFRVFHETEKAKDFVVSTSDTLVIKEEGLAGGKGVTIAHTNEEKLAAVEKHIAKGAILVEEFLLSHEFSFIGFADGRNFVPLLPARDHKRLNTNDTGPNTGGMGSYCPADFVTEKIREELQRDAEKVVRETGFKGALYLGGGVRNGERLLYEFNCRFGDPETSVQLLMMKSDIYEYIDKSIEGKLDSLPPIENKEGAAVCVVMAAPGYPDKPIIAGGQIYGLEKIKQNDDLIIFHAGTEIRAGMIVTSRGRVLEISARGRSLRQASNRAYRVVERLSWNGGQYYRTDIGKLR